MRAKYSKYYFFYSCDVFVDKLFIVSYMLVVSMKVVWVFLKFSLSKMGLYGMEKFQNVIPSTVITFQYPHFL